MDAVLLLITWLLIIWFEVGLIEEYFHRVHEALQRPSSVICKYGIRKCVHEGKEI